MNIQAVAVQRLRTNLISSTSSAIGYLFYSQRSLARLKIIKRI